MATNQADTDDEDEDESVDVSYSAGRRGPDREDMVASYLPEKDDWLSKTLLELNDPGRIAALAQFDQLFPEVKDLQPVIDGFLDQFLRGQTSIGGRSRDEYRDMFMSMYGGKADDGKKVGQVLADAFAADVNDD